jgi:hypothetical protein
MGMDWSCVTCEDIASSNICFSADYLYQLGQSKGKRSRKRDRKRGGNARCNTIKKDTNNALALPWVMKVARGL